MGREHGARITAYIAALAPAVRREVKKLRTAARAAAQGTVRFPLDAPPSAALVAKLVKARMVQMRAGKPVG